MVTKTNRRNEARAVLRNSHTDPTSLCKFQPVVQFSPKKNIATRGRKILKSKLFEHSKLKLSRFRYIGRLRAHTAREQSWFETRYSSARTGFCPGRCVA